MAVVRLLVLIVLYTRLLARKMGGRETQRLDDEKMMVGGLCTHIDD